MKYEIFKYNYNMTIKSEKMMVNILIYKYLGAFLSKNKSAFFNANYLIINKIWKKI
jgi:hypothetical protein